MKNIGKLLKEQRELKNLSLKTVSSVVGISDSKLNRMERNEVEEPSPKTIKKLANYYEADLVKFYISCGYLDMNDLEKYQQYFSGVNKLTPEEKDFIQNLINLFLKNKRGENNDI